MAGSETTQYGFRYWSIPGRFRSKVRRCNALISSGALLAALTFAQTQAPPSTLKIVVLEGEGAINNIHQRHAKDPVVQVVDATGAPVNGASVTFLMPDTGPSGAFEASGQTLTVLTDNKGQAMGRGLVPNTVAGKFEIRVVASHNGETAKVVITQTNAQPVEAGTGGSSKKILLLALIGGAAAGGAALAARGHGGGSPSPSISPAPPSSPQGTIIIPGIPVFQGPH